MMRLQRHDRDPFVDERQLRDVQQLLLGFVFHRDAFDPGFDGRAGGWFDEFVGRVCHFDYSISHYGVVAVGKTRYTVDQPHLNTQ